MQMLTRRVTPHVRCPDEGVQAGCRPVLGAWGRTATGREAGTPLGLRPRLHTPYCGQTTGSRLLGAVSMLWGHTSTASRCVTPPHTAAGGTACPPAADSMPRGPRGAPPSSPPGPLPTVGAASRSGPALRGLRPPAHPPHSERGSRPVAPPAPRPLPAQAAPTPAAEGGAGRKGAHMGDARCHPIHVPWAEAEPQTRGRPPSECLPPGSAHSTLLCWPPGHRSRGGSVWGVRRGQSCPPAACLRGLGDSPGSAADRAPPRGAAGALADLRHGLRPLATRAEGPDPPTTLNGWAAGSWCRVERDCWCGWPRAGGRRGGGGASPPPCTH